MVEWSKAAREARPLCLFEYFFNRVLHPSVARVGSEYPWTLTRRDQKLVLKFVAPEPTLTL